MREGYVPKTTEWMPPRHSKGPVYTVELTPREEVSEQLGAILDAILYEPGEEVAPRQEAHVSFNKLDEEDRKKFVSYCEELDCLHEEYDWILFELDGAVRYLYPYRLDWIALSLVYHEDNFYFRMHAYREKVFKLINYGLGLKIPDDSRNLRNFNDAVLEKVRERGLTNVADVLTKLCGGDRVFSDAFQRRKHLTHLLAIREPIRKPGSAPTTSRPTALATARRINAHIFGVSGLDEIQSVADLHTVHMETQKRLGDICERLAQFRDDLVAALKRVGF